MRKIIVFVVVLINVQSFFAQQLWHKIDKANAVKQQKELYIDTKLPKKYQLFSFKNSFFLELSTKSLESKKTIIQLPDENGELSDFYLQRLQIFHPDLAKKYPTIQSYKAINTKDKSITARISVGVNGMNTVVTSPSKKAIIIAPFSKDKSQYIVYSRKNLEVFKESFDCKVFGSNLLRKKAAKSKKGNDGLLRNYRIAIVASAEYSQYHLNREGVSNSASEEVKKTAVLSAINTSLTRVNEIFERELSVNFTLVANNDKIIFFDTNTDGITNSSVSEMIDESQLICDREIGNANYDIGHLVSQGENTGLAAGGSICLTGQKARATTNKIVPIGDSFDVDFFAHEIGHQFGAFHTYNNSCNENRNSATSIEPGSGSTIMSYAGICSPNVQPQVDDYFHTVSLVQMWNVIQSSSCATTTNLNNTKPTVSAGSDFVIPKGTPFVLSGDASDLENDNTLTYSWEQTDREIAPMPPLSSNNVGPLFRSLAPKESNKRYFPSLLDVIEGSILEWEVLPTVARDMNFTLTVRDNNPSGGSFATDDIQITVADVPPFQITSQNSSTTWDVGSTQTISWAVGTTNQNPVNTQFVTVYLSEDGGKTFPIVLVENTVNDGSVSFVVPDNVTENARIMIKADNNIYYDVNDSPIKINSTIPTFIFSIENENGFACNITEETVAYNLSLDFVNDFAENVTFSTQGLPTGATVSFSPETINQDGEVQVVIANLNGVTAQDYVLQFTGTSNTVTQNVSANLVITNTVTNGVSLVLPSNGAEEIPVAAGFSWEENSNASSYIIQIATDVAFNELVTEASSTINAFAATNLKKGIEYFWRVKPINTCSEGVFSEVFSFTTEVCELCVSEGNTDFDTSTTFVGFNTIANETPNKTSGYMDFTSISTTVARDSIYSLVVNANTADDNNGVFTTRTIVWIDWNQNCDLDEDGEVYDLGTTTGNINGQTSLSPLEIKVPSDAILGNTIMRVTTKYENDGLQTPCEIGADAEVEDYTIVVDETAGTNDFDFGNFEMYPNPATNEVTIKLFIKNRTSLQFQVIDLRGRLVEEQTFENLGDVFLRTIPLTKKDSGLYFVRLINGDSVLVKRLIIR